MKYFKYIDREINPGEIIYYELDEKYYCLRAILDNNNKLMTTNFIDDYYFLPEGSFDDCSVKLLEEITENEFKRKLEIALKPFLENWNEIKNVNIAENNIKVRIKCMYPQGIIFDINGMFYGIADYNECKVKYRTNNLYPKKMNLIWK
jgi:hypothetical protein